MAVARRKPTHRADGAPVYFRGLNAAPKLAAATGGAVVAAGLSMAGAGTAIAHQGVWDEVAQCESGGNWSINTGNGRSEERRVGERGGLRSSQHMNNRTR